MHRISRRRHAREVAAGTTADALAAQGTKGREGDGRGARPASTSFLAAPFGELFAGHRGTYAALVLASLVTLAMTVLPSFAMGVVIDTAFATHSRRQLMTIMGTLLLVHVVRLVTERASERLSSRVRKRNEEALMARLVERLARAPLMVVEAKSPVTINNRLNAIKRIVGFYVDWYVLALSRPLFFALVLGWLAFESRLLTSAILVMTLVYVRLYWLSSQKLRMCFARESEQAEARAAALHEFTQALGTLHIVRRVRSFYEGLAAKGREDDCEAGGDDPDAQGAASGPWLSHLTKTYSSAAFIVVFSLGGWQVIGGELSVGHLIVVNVVFRRILAETRVLIARIRRYYRTAASAEMIGRLLDDLAPPQDEAPVEDQDRARVPAFERIVLRGVGLRRAKADAPVLSDVGLEIRRGQFVAVVGPSGGGKTTLLKMIGRLYAPTSGSVAFVGGEGSEGLAYVSAGDTVFNFSVHGNIAPFGDATREHVTAAARAALADDFIASLPQGYDTLLGSQGLSLSQGQKMRLSLARGFASQAGLLLMDEPTSPLDPAIERRFLDQLREFRGHKTIVMVTHRPAPALEADVVVVVQAGRVVECGAPAALRADARSAFSLWCRDSVADAPQESPEPGCDLPSPWAAGVA
ncbi:MAG: ATP-binding cassette domain-containing protein [Burkholderiaceae bacterium]